MRLIALAALALTLAACGETTQPLPQPTPLTQPTPLPTSSQLDCPQYVECHEP